MSNWERPPQIELSCVTASGDSALFRAADGNSGDREVVALVLRESNVSAVVDLDFERVEALHEFLENWMTDHWPQGDSDED